jgi:succinyl-CoA synthetase beta subunit
MVVASSQGGVDIESVAAENPEAILKLPVNIDQGLQMSQARELATKLGFSTKSVESAADMMMRLYKLFMDKDATMVEINPMAESATGEGTALVSSDSA